MPDQTTTTPSSTAQKRRRRPRHAFLIEWVKGKPPRKILLPVYDGQREVKLHRTVADVLAGKQGDSLTCANSVCAERNEKLFGHPVYHCDFTTSHCFVIDGMDKYGQLSRCSKYTHDEGDWQKEFDKKSKRTIISAGIAEHTIVLRPPKRQRKSQVGIKTNHKGRKDQSRSSHVPYGATRRIWHANREWVKANGTVKKEVRKRTKSKNQLVMELALRPEQGVTHADALKVTGWTSISMPQQARDAGLVLSKNRERDKPTYYFAIKPEGWTPPKSWT